MVRPAQQDAVYLPRMTTTAPLGTLPHAVETMVSFVDCVREMINVNDDYMMNAIIVRASLRCAFIFDSTTRTHSHSGIGLNWTAR